MIYEEVDSSTRRTISQTTRVLGTLKLDGPLVLGLALIALTLTGTIGVWGWIGVVPLATGALSSCPLYSILGFNTCPMKKG